MNELIVFLLVLMVIEHAVGLAYDFSIRARNERTATRAADVFENENKRLKARISDLEAHLKIVEESSRRLAARRWGGAMLLTQDGVKVLPNDWGKYFDAAWAEKPVTP